MQAARVGILCLIVAAVLPAKTIQVLAWSERSEPVDVYPRGIHTVIAEMFSSDATVDVRVANLLDPEQGLAEATLAETDVLVWFGHRSHEAVADVVVERVVRHVTERGMGFLPLHSAHYAKPFVALMERRASSRGVVLEGRTGKWGRVQKDVGMEQVRVLDAKHPITRGVAAFVIPESEMYANPFVAPAPDVKLLAGAWDGGEQDGSDGLVWEIGRGRVFYFRPGHETYPIFYQTEVQQVLRNAIRWLAEGVK